MRIIPPLFLALFFSCQVKPNTHNIHPHKVLVTLTTLFSVHHCQGLSSTSLMPIESEGFPLNQSGNLPMDNSEETDIAIYLPFDQAFYENPGSIPFWMGLLATTAFIGTGCWIWNDCLKEFDRKREDLHDILSRLVANSSANNIPASVAAHMDVPNKKLLKLPPGSWPQLQLHGKKLRGKFNERLYIKRGFCGRLCCNPCLGADLCGRCCCDYDYTCCLYECRRSKVIPSERLHRIYTISSTGNNHPMPIGTCTPSLDPAAPQPIKRPAPAKVPPKQKITCPSCTYGGPTSRRPWRWCQRKTEESQGKLPRRTYPCFKYLGCALKNPSLCCGSNCIDLEYTSEFPPSQCYKVFTTAPCCFHYRGCCIAYFSHFYQRRETCYSHCGKRKPDPRELLKMEQGFATGSTKEDDVNTYDVKAAQDSLSQIPNEDIELARKQLQANFSSHQNSYSIEISGGTFADLKISDQKEDELSANQTTTEQPT